MSLAINIDTYIGALLTEITYHGTPVDDSKTILHHKKLFEINLPVPNCFFKLETHFSFDI